MTGPWNEKRKYPRIRVCCPVSFISFDKLRIGETADLSLGGMKILCRAILLRGGTYEFTLVMNGRAITPKGKIIYLENKAEFTYGVGVSFLDLPHDDQAELNIFLSAQEL